MRRAACEAVQSALSTSFGSNGLCSRMAEQPAGPRQAAWGWRYQLRRAETVFSRYLRSLASGAEVDDASFRKVWKALRQALMRRLKRRGMWDRSPSLLGVIGHARWTEADGASSDALDELTADAYTFVFIDRLRSLLAQVAARPQVEGLVHLAIGHFLHDRQRRSDPLGTRLYSVLNAAIEPLLEAGELSAQPMDDRLRATTVLTFADVGSATPAMAEQVSAAVGDWIDSLLPELVTTTGRGFAPLLARVGDRIVGLADEGIDAFRFGDLIDPLRRHLRRRWTALPRTAHDAEAGPALLPAVESTPPDRAYESRRRFADLVDCVAQRLQRTDVPEDTLALLEALWAALVDGARDDPDRSETPTGIPSKRQLARDLEISRDRLSTLYEMVEGHVRTCLDQESLKTSERPTMSQDDPESARAQDRLMRQLHRRTIAAASQVRPGPQRALTAAEAPRVGGLYALAEGPHCEWLVLDRLANDPGRVLAAPADTLPLVGAGDLAIAADSPIGPLSVRCRLALALPEALFLASNASGQLAEDDRARALAIATADDEPASEALPDPQLEAWIRQLSVASEALLSTPAAEVKESAARFGDRRPKPTSTLVWSLAAALAGLALGVGLSRMATTAPAIEPSLESASPRLYPLETMRGSITLRFPADAQALSVPLVLSEILPCDRVEVTLRQHREVRWQQSNRLPDDGVLLLRLPRGFFDPGLVIMRITAHCDGKPPLSVDRAIDIVIDSRAPVPAP